MNKRPHRTWFTLLSILCVIPALSIARADSSIDQLRTQETHQQQLRSQTQAVGEQIDLIIGEFERNAMDGGQDVKTLRSIRVILGQLSDQQLQQVIVLLQQARDATDGGLGDEKQAYLTQQGILRQFHDLLNQYEKDKSVYDLADRFDRLAKREAANLRSMIDLAQAAAGKKPEQLDPVIAAALATQQSEQASIASEVQDALNAAASLQNELQGPDADQLKQAVSQANSVHLSATPLSAASDLQTNDLFRAASGEKDARDALRELTDSLSPPKSALEIKKDQLMKIDSELEKEKEIADQTKSPVASNSMNGLLHQADLSQAANVDDTDESRQKLANLSPTVAQSLKQAESQMQQARGGFAQHRRDRGAQGAGAAADQLQLAKDALQKEIAQNEAATPETVDKLAQAKQLLDQVKQIRAQQKDLADGIPATQPVGTPAGEQRSLATKTQSLQQQSATSAPAAASALGDAGKQMASAADSIAQSDQPTAQSQQQAADAALAKAQDGLQQQANQLQQAQNQLSQLQQSQQQIADLIKKQADVALATVRQAAQPTTQPAAETPADPSANTPEQQKQIADQTAATQSQVPAAARQAAAALNDAHQQMDKAADQLRQNKAQDAETAQGEAISDLGKAAVSLSGTMDQLKTQLGQPAGDPATASAAEEALKQAAEQLQKAQGQLDQAQSGQTTAAQQAEKSLDAAAQSAAAAMGKNDSQAAAGALEQAISQINRADGQDQRGQTSAAQQSAAAAQNALAQAQATLAAGMPQPGNSHASGSEQSAAQSSAEATATPSPASQTPASSNGTGTGIGQKPGDRAAQDGGPRGETDGASALVKLPARDRQALQQSQAEKYPEEYGNMVEQYLKNLSDSDNK